MIFCLPEPASRYSPKNIDTAELMTAAAAGNLTGSGFDLLERMESGVQQDTLQQDAMSDHQQLQQKLHTALSDVDSLVQELEAAKVTLSDLKALL